MEAALPMNPRVETVEAETDFQLLVTFETGEYRRFDMKPYIAHGGVFAELADPGYFAMVRPFLGSIAWPHEQDLSYDTLYLQGEPVPALLL